MPKIGGDPHLVVVNEKEWIKNMGEELNEFDICNVPELILYLYGVTPPFAII